MTNRNRSTLVFSTWSGATYEIELMPAEVGAFVIAARKLLDGEPGTTHLRSHFQGPRTDYSGHDGAIVNVRTRRRRRQKTTVEKGYGAVHRRVRAQVAKHVATGMAVCWRCNLRIHPLAEWHLGHDDRYPHAKLAHIYRGPEHAECSHASGGWKRQGVLRPPPLRRQPAPKAPAALAFWDV